MQLLLVASSVLSLIAFVQADDHFPHPCQETHLVTASETCKSISSKFNITEANIEEWNREFIPQFDCSRVKQGNRVCVKYSSSASVAKRSDDSQKKHLNRNPKKGSDSKKKSANEKAKSRKSKKPTRHTTTKKHATAKRSYRKQGNKKEKKHHSKKGPKKSSTRHHSTKKSATENN